MATCLSAKRGNPSCLRFTFFRPTGCSLCAGGRSPPILPQNNPLGKDSLPLRLDAYPEGNDPADKMFSTSPTRLAPLSKSNRVSIVPPKTDAPPLCERIQRFGTFLSLVLAATARKSLRFTAMPIARPTLRSVSTTYTPPVKEAQNTSSSRVKVSDPLIWASPRLRGSVSPRRALHLSDSRNFSHLLGRETQPL